MAAGCFYKKIRLERLVEPDVGEALVGQAELDGVGADLEGHAPTNMTRRPARWAGRRARGARPWVYAFGPEPPIRWLQSLGDLLEARRVRGGLEDLLAAVAFGIYRLVHIARTQGSITTTSQTTSTEDEMAESHHHHGRRH